VTALVPINVGCWTDKTPLPHDLLDPGGSALNGKLFVVGGKDAEGHRSDLYAYDPVADIWDVGPDLPGPAVENPAVVAHGGKLYVFGGSTEPFSGAVTNAAVFDPTADAWTPLPSLPTARGGATAQAIGDQLYVAGGMGADGASVATVEVFDPSAGEGGAWSTAPSMSVRRDNPGSAALDGRLYVFGGRTRDADGTEVDGTLTSVEMYDPGTETWTGRAPMPTGRRAMVVGTLNGRAQVMGGERTPMGGTFAANEEYDPVANTWRAVASMPTPRHGAAAATIGDVVFVAGGGPEGGSALSSVHEAFSFVRHVTGPSPPPGEDLPPSKAAAPGGQSPPVVTPPTCGGVRATIIGTPGDDVRRGTPGRDVIVGSGGNDRLSGLAGNDVICGGSGEDTLKGGKGVDTLLGQKGKDRLKGGAGRDLCNGGKGTDTAAGCETERSI
jgi:N-acetylneuraminic acid mutarotase